MITFITSIRHPLNCNGPFRHVLNLLEQTLRSICQQTRPGFRVLVIGNEPFELSFRDNRIEYIWVDFPAPSPLHQASFGMPGLRLDRGCKYVVGLLAARTYRTDHVMLVDADDYVSNRLNQLSEQSPSANGWYLREGFVYDRAVGTLGLLDDFHLRCGTSHIFAHALMEIPANLTPQSSYDDIVASVPRDYLLRVLGSHRWIAEHCAALNRPLIPLPFPGAIYHIGHGENHTARSGVLEMRPVRLTDILLREFRLTLGLTEMERDEMPQSSPGDAT
jgi:hypothetical protein